MGIIATAFYWLDTVPVMMTNHLHYSKTVTTTHRQTSTKYGLTRYNVNETTQTQMDYCMLWSRRHSDDPRACVALPRMLCPRSYKSGHNCPL